MNNSNIYVLDKEDFEKADVGRKMEIVRDVENALHIKGFLRLKNHGISKKLKERFYDQSFTFFEKLPLKVKENYERPEIGRQRGYTSFGIEKAKDAKVYDLKEFWQIGQDPQGFDKTQRLTTHRPRRSKRSPTR